MSTAKFSPHAADNIRLYRSHVLQGAVSADTYQLIRIPHKGFVTDVWLWVETACSSIDISVGWEGNGETAQTAGFMSQDITDVLNTGLKRAQHNTLVAFEGKYFNNSGGVVTLTVGTTLTAGKMTVFAQCHVVY